MTDRRSRTVTITVQNRGQTTQDFAIGIGVFLLAIAFVFSFMPTVITPFDTTGGGGGASQAERISGTIVDDLTDPDRPNHLLIDDENDVDDLKASANDSSYLGVRSSDGDVAFDRVSIELETLGNNSTAVMTAGQTYEGQGAGSAARIVTVENDDWDCDPACRLVVRVW